MAELQSRIGFVPAQHAQGGQVAHVGFVGEVGQRDFARFGLAKAGDKQQIARHPGLMAAALDPALDGQAIEHAAQHHDGQLALVKVHKKDAPGLVRHQRFELLDGVDGDMVLGLEVQLLGLPVVNGIFPIVHVHGPVQLFLEVLDQRGNGVNAAEFFSLGVECGCHGFASLCSLVCLLFGLFGRCVVSSVPSRQSAQAPRPQAPAPGGNNRFSGASQPWRGLRPAWAGRSGTGAGCRARNG